MQAPEMIGSYRPPLATPMPVMGTYGPSMEPPGPGMEHSWQQIEQSGQHIRPSGQHMGSSGQHMRPPGPGLGPFWQHMRPSVQHIGPPVICIVPPGQHIEPSGQHIEPSGQHIGPPGPGMGPSWQHMGHPGPGMGPSGPNTGSLEMSGSQMGSPGMPPIPQVQPVMPNYRVSKPNLQPVKPVNQPADDLWVETTSPTGQERNKQTEVIEEKKPESETEQKPESKAEQKPAPKSKPVASTPIPDTVWRVVQTNDGRHFFYNTTKRHSVWKIPEELKNRPDVDKLLSSKQEIKTEIKEKMDLQEEPPSKKIKLEVQVKEEKEESNNEFSQQTVFKKKTTNAAKVQAAEIMPVSFEDKKKKFKELIVEKDILTHSLSLPLQKHKQKFEEIVKNRAEEEHMKRYKQIEGNSELFIQLLEESILSAKSTFNYFVVTYSYDKRFGLVDNFRDKKILFQDYISKLAQQEEALQCALIKQKVKNDFMKMLSEMPDIDQHTLWSDVRSKLYLDPRYKAVALDSRRKHWFSVYLRTQNYVTSDDISKKEVQEERLHSSSLKRKNTSQPKNRDAAFEDFKQFLVENIKDATKERFSKFHARFFKSPRWPVELSRKEKQRLYKNHITAIRKKNKEFLGSILDEMDVTPDDIRKKEVQGKQLHSSLVKGENTSSLNRDAAFEDFKQFLTEKVKDATKKRFSKFQAMFFKSPRWTMELSRKEKQRLYNNHITAIRRKNKEFLGSILDEMDVTPDDIRKKEVQGKQLHSSSVKGKNTSSLNRDAAFEDFKQFLTETVKDTKDRKKFSTFQERYFKSPRWTMELTSKEKKRLYNNHVFAIHKKNLEILGLILDDMNLPLEPEWSEVKKRIQADPRYANYTDSEEQLVPDYAQCMHKKNFKPEDKCSSQSSATQKKGQEVYSSW